MAGSGRGPVAVSLPLTSKERHGRQAGERAPVEPPALRATAGAARAAAGPKARAADGEAGPRASNLYLLPGAAVGDTSLQLFFDAPAAGWTGGQIKLYAAADTSTVLHAAEFTSAQLVVCGSPAKFCWTLDNTHGWDLHTGAEYVVTVTLTTPDGQAEVSAFSEKETPRVLPVPPAVPAEQLRGPRRPGSTGRSDAQPVLRGFGVNAATGALTRHAIDAVTSSAYRVNVSAERTYSSADKTAGLLGVGWNFSHDARVYPKPDTPGAMVYRAEDGTESTFTRHDNGSYASPPGVRSSLTAVEGGGWRVTTPEQERWTFDSNGRLVSVADAGGKGVHLAYTGSGTSAQLASLTDAGGRKLAVTVTGGRLEKLELPDGRSVSYTFAGDRLRTVRDPDGAVTTYDYDDQGRLTTITDSLGHRQLTTGYDQGTGRVATQADYFGKVTKFAWDADKSESKTTDPDGAVVWDGFRGNVLHYTQNGNNDTTVYRYDSRLNRQVLIDPLGRQYDMTHDARGNVTASALRGAHPVTEKHIHGVVEKASFDEVNNLLSATDGRDKTARFTYTEDKQIKTATDAEGHISRYEYFEGTRLLKSVTDPLGRTTAYTYHGDGAVASVTDRTKAKTTYGYDKTGRLTSTTDPRGNAAGVEPGSFMTTTRYDGLDRVRQVTDPRGGVRKYDYDPAGRLATFTDANTHATTLVYNDANQLTRLVDSDERTTDYTYTAAGRLASVKDGAGNLTRYSYDMAGRLKTEVSPRGSASGGDPAAHTITYSYDWNGNRIAVARPYPGGGDPQVIRFVYDSLNQLTSVIDPLGRTTKAGYDPAGNRVAATDAAGRTRAWSYDGNNQVVATTDPRNHTTRFHYDPAGQLDWQQSPTGAKTTFGYDLAGRLTKRTAPRGNVDGADADRFTTHYGYDPAGNQTTVIDPRGGVTATEYDATNNPTRRVDANGHATVYTYDAENRLTRIKGPDATNDTQVTVNVYDHAGHLIQRTDPLGFHDDFHYDRAGRLDRVTDKIGRHREYRYDPDGNISEILTARATSAADPAERARNTITQRYDTLGRLVERVMGNGSTHSFGYDAANQLTALTDPAGKETRGYDNTGRLNAVTRGASSFAYTYDAAGNLETRALPGGGAETLTYNADNRPDTLTSQAGKTSYDYDPDGNLTATSLPGGSTQRRSFDPLGRVASLTNHGPGEKALSAYAVERDKVGNPTRLDTTQGGTVRSDGFTYDAANRLTAMCYRATTCTGAADKLSYTYDLVGNRKTRTRTGSSAFSETYDYDAASRLRFVTGVPGQAGGTITYDYDADGNETRAGDIHRSFDLDNQVISIAKGGNKTVYTEDAAGNRISAKTTEGASTTETTYLWDVNNPLPMLAAENVGNEGARAYTHNPDGTPLGVHAGGDDHLYLPDPFGNVAALTDTAGAIKQQDTMLDPFGEFEHASPGGPDAPSARLGFHGQYDDPLSGAYHVRARDYTPGVGRFHGVDPIPQKTNQATESPYSYANNNPLTGRDPSGQKSCADDACEGDWVDAAGNYHHRPTKPDSTISSTGSGDLGLLAPPPFPVQAPPRVVAPPGPVGAPPVGRTFGVIAALALLLSLGGDSVQNESVEVDTKDGEEECRSGAKSESTYVYFNLDDKRRARGAVSCLSPWVRTNHDGDPPTPRGFKPDMDRSHLIAREFGGHAIRENIVPLWRKANQVDMRRVEGIVRSRLAAGERVYYAVIPVYHAGLEPAGLQIYIGSESGTHEEFVFNRP